MSDINQIQVTVLPGGRVDRRAAAAYLGRKPATLAAWASQGVGPRLLKSRGRVFYELSELDRFMREGDVA